MIFTLPILIYIMNISMVKLFHVMFIFAKSSNEENILNQVRVSCRPVHLVYKIDPVWIDGMHVRVCVWVCVRTQGY